LTHIGHSEKVLFMRVFIAVLILIFSLQSLSKADSASDFQIDEISVGDSLLDHFDENEIIQSLQNPTYYPMSNKMKVILFYPKKSDRYERYDVHIKEDDSNYIIYAVKGLIKISIDKCLNQKKKVVSEIEYIFSDAGRKDYTDNYANAYGNSKAYITDFTLSDGRIRIWCMEWDQNNEKVILSGWWDGLSVNISSKEQIDFITKEAYK